MKGNGWSAYMRARFIIAAAFICLGFAFVSFPVDAQSTITGVDWGGTTSTTSYMASHRFQRHSVVTSEGAIHIIVNTGLVSGSSSTGALELWTNSGSSWSRAKTFYYSVGYQSNNTVSTDDVNLVEVSGTQYLQVAYDVQGVPLSGGGTGNAVMYTVLSYNPTSHTWTEGVHYPVMAASNASLIYQQPAITEDQSGGLWLTSLVLNSTVTGGQINIFKRVSGVWTNMASIVTTGQIPHAGRPVMVPSATADIGLLYQANHSGLPCLYWVTVTGTLVSASTELSQYSNSPASTQCNLASQQTAWDDTAASIATDPSTGDQYLGFAVENGSGGTAVYTITYEASTAAWLTATAQTLAFADAVYVKSALQNLTTSGTTTPYPIAYMVVNTGGAGELLFLSSDTLETGSTMYTVGNDLSAMLQPGTYLNPRIEVPQYINSAFDVPVWEQYLTTMMGTPRSLVFWNVPQ